MPSPVARRETILIHARRLFAERGVAATSVRDIAEAVGMLSGSLYHHYNSKDAMVDAVLVDYLEDLVTGYGAAAGGEPDPIERIGDLVQFTFNIAREKPEATAIYRRDGAMLAEQERFSYVADAAARIREIWLATLREGKEAGVVRADLDGDVAYRLIRDSIWLAANWFTPQADYPTNRFLKDCTAVFLTGYQCA